MTYVANIPEEDMLRARFYGLLARVLAAPMSAETLTFVRGLQGDDTEMGRALATFASLAQRATKTGAEEEYSELFFGMGAGGELGPYASRYLTGFVYEKPLADLRETMAEFGIAAADGLREPEDHIAFLCEVMHGLITGRFGKPVGLDGQRSFFKKHIQPWGTRFFEDVERAKAAVLYMPVGTIGKLLIAIEAEAFEMAA
ncbi:MAG: molecular chaperone TorD [Rhodospirillales bacterium]|nr:molecular chaperone TorD [Rhodospirillales bacterium]